jgi:predicted nuclease with TOPRIM domain
MADVNFTEEQKNKLKELVREAVSVMTEVEALQGGLKDTVAAVAEEMQIKPSALNRAIKYIYKGDYDRARDDLDTVESILHATNKLTD